MLSTQVCLISLWVCGSKSMCGRVVWQCCWHAVEFWAIVKKRSKFFDDQHFSLNRKTIDNLLQAGNFRTDAFKASICYPGKVWRYVKVQNPRPDKAQQIKMNLDFEYVGNDERLSTNWKRYGIDTMFRVSLACKVAAQHEWHKSQICLLSVNGGILEFFFWCVIVDDKFVFELHHLSLL